MKIGICGKFDLIAQAQAAGFDYLEPPVNAVAAMSDEDFDKALQTVLKSGIPCPSFNLLFPKNLQLLSPETDNAMILGYLEGALARVQALGGRITVFGSGKSRNRPEGMSYSDAFRRLTEITRLIGEVAAKYDITVVIEPLCRAETNMINYVSEGAALVAAAHHPNIQLLADLYHIAADGEQIGDIQRLGGVIHAHVATKQGRRYPITQDDDLTDFIKALKETGYAGNISVEGKTDDMAKDGPAAVTLLKKLWEDA